MLRLVLSVFVYLFEVFYFFWALMISLPFLIVFELQSFVSTPKSTFKSIENQIRISQKIPFGFGAYYFRLLVNINSPFASSIPFYVNSLNTEPLAIEACMDDRFWLRNPFGSLHLAALCNLGETTSGIIMLAMMEKFRRKFPKKKIVGIPNEISMKFLKKSRGRITAKVDHIDLPSDENKTSKMTVHVEMFDREGTLTATLTGFWQITVSTAINTKKED